MQPSSQTATTAAAAAPQQINAAAAAAIQTLAAGYVDHERAFLDFIPLPNQLAAAPWSEAPSDIARGKMFLEHFGSILRYVPELDTFRVWLGSSGWFSDETGNRMRAYAASLATHFRKEAIVLALTDRAALTAAHPGATPPKDEIRKTEDGIKARFKAVDAMSSVHGIDAMLAMAKTDGPVTVPLSRWDADPMLLGVNNGVLNLETREFSSGRPDDHVTKRMDVVYDPSAKCPKWERFLNRVLPDPEIRSYVQRTVGYTLTGLTGDQRFYFLHGNGKNGKSVFINVLSAIFGAYAGKARREVVEESKNGSTAYTRDLALFPGTRFLFGEETSAHGRLREDLIKSITAGDPVTADPKFKTPFTFTPVAKLWLCGNHKPVIEGTDLGIWRRVVLIPFTQTIPDSEQIPHDVMHRSLVAEAAGILNWALEGLAEWKQGDIPQAIRDAVEEYRRDEDDLAEFLADTTAPAPGKLIDKNTMYQVYRNWAMNNGLKLPWTQKRFSRRLAERDGWEFDAGRRNWVGQTLTVDVTLIA